MRELDTKLVRKWTTILVPTLALLLGCLTGPGAFLLKATVKELVRQELAGYQTITAADARWKAHQDFEAEVFKRWEHDLATLRNQPTLGDTNHANLLLEISSRLTSLETKLKLMLSEPPPGEKLPGAHHSP